MLQSRLLPRPTRRTPCPLPLQTYADRIWTTGEVRGAGKGRGACDKVLRSTGAAAPPAARPAVPPLRSAAAPRSLPPQVGWPGVGHIAGKPGQTKDYSAVIAAAQALPGFEWEPEEAEVKCVRGSGGGCLPSRLLRAREPLCAALLSAAGRRALCPRRRLRHPPLPPHTPSLPAPRPTQARHHRLCTQRRAGRGWRGGQGGAGGPSQAHLPRGRLRRRGCAMM